jgi:hypothetical protein
MWEIHFFLPSISIFFCFLRRATHTPTITNVLSPSVAPHKGYWSNNTGLSHQNRMRRKKTRSWNRNSNRARKTFLIWWTCR